MAMSEGVIKESGLSECLYFPRSRNLPSTMPEFFWAGSKMEIESSDRKKERMNLRSISSGTFVMNLAVNRRTVLSLSMYLKKSLFGFSGRSLNT